MRIRKKKTNPDISTMRDVDGFDFKNTSPAKCGTLWFVFYSVSKEAYF